MTTLTSEYRITRPIMTAEELASHKTGEHGRIGCGDGYDDMEIAASRGWKALPCWGKDGWDLGDWPYVAVYSRLGKGGKWELATIVEGDHTIYEFNTGEDLHAAIDYLFIWYGIGRDYDEWKAAGLTDRASLNAGTMQVPEEFRGPYRQN